MKGRARKYPPKMGKLLKKCPNCGFEKGVKEVFKQGESAWEYYNEFYPCPKCGHKVR